MKLTLHNDINSLYIAGSLSYNESDYVGIEKTKLETSVSTGYTDKLLAEEWDDLKWLLDYDYQKFRNELINTFASAAVWDTLTDTSKKALVRNYVWKSSETTANLDFLYTQDERDTYLEGVLELLNTCDCNILKSSSTGSNRYFETRPDDAGVITTTEIKSDITL